MTDIAIEFVDELPPQSGPGPRIDWPEALRPLTKHPGRWAKVRHLASDSGAYTLCRRIKEAMPEGEWEAAGRRTDGKGSGSGLYVRYLGPQKATGNRP